MEPDAAAVQERLRLPDAFFDHLGEDPVPPARLPAPDEAGPLLARMGVPPGDRQEILAALPSLGTDRCLRWVLDRCRRRLAEDMGGFGPLGPWPSLPYDLGAAGRYFYVCVFLAVLPEVLAWQRDRQIPEEITWATLADLGRNVGIHRRVHGVGGLDAQNWLTLHFRGGIYQLGRLQFNRGRIRWSEQALAGLDVPFRPGDPALGVHIPESGPMTPEACDESFRQASAFFARHFPEETYRFATCGSWLLDEQLAEYLPAGANILRFQQRFRLLPGDGRNSDATVIRFVFRRVEPDLDDLPQCTTLERAVVRHIRAGRHWQSRHGWLPLEPPP